MGYSNKSLAYKNDALILVFVYTLDALTHHIALHRMQFELEYHYQHTKSSNHNLNILVNYLK